MAQAHAETKPLRLASNSMCPSDIIRAFAGKWNGNGIKIGVDGSRQQTQTKDEFAILDCQRFEIKVNYVNAAGTPTRVIDLIATSASPHQGRRFTLEGTMQEGTSVSKMKGSITSVHEGTLLLTFTGALSGQPAYFTELMNLTTASGVTQIVRTVQIFSGCTPGGPYLASRVTVETRQ